MEARLRLMSSTARDELPEEPAELAKLAQALGYTDGGALLADCEQVTHENRRLFEEFVRQAGT